MRACRPAGASSSSGDRLFALPPPPPSSSLLIAAVVMYVSHGAQVGGYDADVGQLYSTDMQLQRHWLVKREVGGNEKWTVNYYTNFTPSIPT